MCDSWTSKHSEINIWRETFEGEKFHEFLGFLAIRESRFCTSKKGGIGGGGWVHPRVPCTRQLPWLAREEPWSALAGPFLDLLAQTGSGTTPLAL